MLETLIRHELLFVVYFNCFLTHTFLSVDNVLVDMNIELVTSLRGTENKQQKSRQGVQAILYI